MVNGGTSRKGDPGTSTATATATAPCPTTSIRCRWTWASIAITSTPSCSRRLRSTCAGGSTGRSTGTPRWGRDRFPTVYCGMADRPTHRSEEVRPDVGAALTALLEERILVLDGAMGTMIQSYRLGERDF